jgi:arabinogalactan endo-1,4-beta-galactosidase
MLRLCLTLSLLWLGGCALLHGGSDIAEVPDDAPFATGVDLSLLQHLQDHGVVYKVNGVTKDPLLIFRDHGVTWVRLRLFVDPDGHGGQVNSLPYTLAMARRVKAAGFKLLLDFHYSDAWADPENQAIPRRWAGLNATALAGEVQTYTRSTLEAFAREGVTPEMVQVGNECRNGMLWPVGGPLEDYPGRWDAFARLLKAAVAGVRQSPGGGRIRVLVHVESGGDAAACRRFFDNLLIRNVPFDSIGLSYYPIWQGPPDRLAKNLAALSTRYRRSIYLVECGAEWAPVRSERPTRSPFPATPAGQQRFVEETIRTVRATPGGRGKGVFYWAPEWIAGRRWDAPGWSVDWERRALFRPDGDALPALGSLTPRP